MVECSECDGEGYVMQTCDEYDGDGQVYCDDCDGTGHEECSWCNGEVARNVSLALVQVEKIVFHVLEMDMTLMEINAICVGEKGVKIVLCAMALVLINVITALEMVMKTVLIAMVPEL